MHGTILLSICLAIASMLSVGLSEVSNKVNTNSDLAKEVPDSSRLKRASTLSELRPGDEDNDELLKLLIEKDLKNSEDREEPEMLVADEQYALPLGMLRLDHQRVRRSAQSPSAKEVVEQESKFAQPSEGGEDLEDMDNFYPRDVLMAKQELEDLYDDNLDSYSDKGFSDEVDDDLNNEESTLDKRNMRMLRLGKRAMNMLRLGKRPMNMLRLGKRPMNMLRLGKRPMNMLRLGKRPMNMLRLGKRPMNMLRLGKRPMNMLRLGKRPMNMLRLGKRSIDTLHL